MSTEITLTLPDETYRRAAHLARLTGRDIAEVLADAIDISLQPFGSEPFMGEPVAELSDAELLAATNSQMDPNQDRRFSKLLHKQRAAKLTINEHSELMALMQIYQEGLLRKAQAFNEAVQRGLRQPLVP